MDLQEGVYRAMEFAKGSLGDTRIRDLRLEEIDSTTVEGTEAWLITLSSEFPPNPMRIPGLGRRPLIGAELDRDYKVFAVSKDTGEVLSMKMRLFEAA